MSWKKDKIELSLQHANFPWEAHTTMQIFQESRSSFTCNLVWFNPQNSISCDWGEWGEGIIKEFEGMEQAMGSPGPEGGSNWPQALILVLTPLRSSLVLHWAAQICATNLTGSKHRGSAWSKEKLSSYPKLHCSHPLTWIFKFFYHTILQEYMFICPAFSLYPTVLICLVNLV